MKRTKRFTREEAEAKVGKRVRILVTLSGVPKGTRGTVTSTAFAGQLNPDVGPAANLYDVVVRWELAPDSPAAAPQGRTARSRVDWFTQEEYERYLEELEEEV